MSTNSVVSGGLALVVACLLTACTGPAPLKPAADLGNMCSLVTPADINAATGGNADGGRPDKGLLLPDTSGCTWRFSATGTVTIRTLDATTYQQRGVMTDPTPDAWHLTNDFGGDGAKVFVSIDEVVVYLRSGSTYAELDMPCAGATNVCYAQVQALAPIFIARVQGRTPVYPSVAPH